MIDVAPATAIMFVNRKQMDSHVVVGKVEANQIKHEMPPLCIKKQSKVRNTVNSRFLFFLPLANGEA